jgi:hypothetical protein
MRKSIRKSAKAAIRVQRKDAKPERKAGIWGQKNQFFSYLSAPIFLPGILPLLKQPRNGKQKDHGTTGLQTGRGVRSPGPSWGILPVNPCGTNVRGRFLRCYPCGYPCGAVRTREDGPQSCPASCVFCASSRQFWFFAVFSGKASVGEGK